jgi:hypothetical protein
MRGRDSLDSSSHHLHSTLEVGQGHLIGTKLGSHQGALAFLELGQKVDVEVWKDKGSSSSGGVSLRKLNELKGEGITYWP